MGGNARGWEIRPQEMKRFGCRRRRFLSNPGEEELRRKHERLKFERRQRGMKGEGEGKKKTVPDVSPHGPTPVAAEARLKQSRNVNKVNGATMTFFFFYFVDRFWLRECGDSVCRATAVTGKPGWLSMERHVNRDSIT